MFKDYHTYIFILSIIFLGIGIYLGGPKNIWLGIKKMKSKKNDSKTTPKKEKKILNKENKKNNKLMGFFKKLMPKKKEKDFNPKKIGSTTPLYTKKFFPSKIQVLYMEKITNYLKENYDGKYVLLTETPLSSLFESSKRKNHKQLKEYTIDFIILEKQEDSYELALGLQVDKSRETNLKEIFMSNDIKLIFLKEDLKDDKLFRLLGRYLGK